MLVVDTSAWIEWFTDSPIADTIGTHLIAQDSCIVPTIVQFELAKWLFRELSPEPATSALAYVGDCRVVALDTSIAIRAAEFCRTHGLATADAIIYATAREAGADLLTCDAHFEGLDGVIYVPKSTT